MAFAQVLRHALRRRLVRALRDLRRWPWLDTLIALRQRFREDRLGMTAGSLTFTTLISLVPLFTVMLALFSAFPIFASFQGALQRTLLRSLVPANIARPVLDALTAFSNNAHRLGSLGLIALLASALTLMLTIDRTLNAIWRVQTPRPIMQRVLVYWAAATLGPLLLGMSLTLSSYAVSASRGLVDALPGGVTLLLSFAEFVAFTAGMAALYRVVPNTYVHWRHAVSGALFVAVVFEVAKKVLAWYVRQIPTYAMVYGAFSAVPIFLVWLYVSWVIVLLGAVIAAYGPTLRTRLVRLDRPGARFDLAVAVLRLLAEVKRASGSGRRAGDIAALLHYDPLQVDAVLDTLARIGWTGRLDENGDPRHVLLCRPEATAARPLLTTFLLERGDPPSDFWRNARFDSMNLQQLIASA